MKYKMHGVESGISLESMSTRMSGSLKINKRKHVTDIQTMLKVYCRHQLILLHIHVTHFGQNHLVNRTPQALAMMIGC